MDRLEGQKPSHEEWHSWSQVVADRLMTCVHVYSRNPHLDIITLHVDRHLKNAIVIDLSHRLHALTDTAETPSDSLVDVAHHDERVIAGLTVLMGDVLRHLPRLSIDRQALLKSPWLEKCNGRIANELFCGANGTLEEGIGSGKPEHGRLAAALSNLLKRERADIRRKPRQALIRTDLPRPQDKSHRRWADHNGQFLNVAGRMD